MKEFKKAIFLASSQCKTLWYMPIKLSRLKKFMPTIKKQIFDNTSKYWSANKWYDCGWVINMIEIEFEFEFEIEFDFCIDFVLKLNWI